MESIHLSLCIMLCLGGHRSSSEILQRQKRNWIIDSFEIDEGYNGKYPYELGKIDVLKDLMLFEIEGQGVHEPPIGILKINEDSGNISVYGSVDFEKYRVLKVVFKARNKHNKVIDTQLGIEIQILDANDNPPTFEKERYEIHIEEATVQDTALITIMASDKDFNEENRIFDLKMVSVTPEPQEMEFFLKHNSGSRFGTISFKGCLDYEKAEKYTIIVEAKDRGKKVRLSSSTTIIINIEDGNNHLPEITGQTGTGKVDENTEKVLVSRLQVRDLDKKGTAAWTAKYQIQGDTNNNFRITTDPETNEGLLYVEKSLDYEETSMKNLSISVENEIAYQLCKVIRKTTGLWEIVTIRGATGKETHHLSTRNVIVTVGDVNEPPTFDQTVKNVVLGENVAAGRLLAAFTATDPDFGSSNRFVYKKGNDPADWITVDPATGKITTSKPLDRESPYVKDNIYNITIYVVDDGKPPMTATATLSIQIRDENDNGPTMNVSTIDMCQSDGPSLANITASDLDEKPFGGPFKFKLLGDVKGKWKVDPSQGHTVSLVKEKTVNSGPFQLLLEVSDLQHKTSTHTLSVTVCTCKNPAKPNCRSRAATGSGAGGGALGIIFFSMLLLAGVLLLAFLVSCKKESITIPVEGSGQQLMNCNTEKLGTDCEVIFQPLNQQYSQNVKKLLKTSQVPTTTSKRSITNTTTTRESQAYSQHTIYQNQKQRNYSQRLTSESENEASQQHQRNTFMDQEIAHRNSMGWSMSKSGNEASQQHQRNTFMDQEFAHGNSMGWSLGASSSMRTTHQDRNIKHGRSMTGGKHSVHNEIGVHREMLRNFLNMKLYNFQTPEQEQGDYAPHVYAEEEHAETGFELDAISNPDIPFKLDMDQDRYLKFNTLASICMPPESTAYDLKTSRVMEKHEEATLTQVYRQNTSTQSQLYKMCDESFDQVIDY